MEVKELLPIGSIVLLEEGIKKLMIYGVKQTDNANGKLYDYIGVVYPEGNMGAGTQFLFNHENIDQIVFRGFEDREREIFIGKLDEFYKQQQ